MNLRRALLIGCFGLLSTLLGLLCTSPVLAAKQEFEIVVANGRVMDPESGLDSIRHIGIRSGKIAAIASEPLEGRTVVNATGLIVAPGFIDVHQHWHDPEGYRFQVMDGVTTSLEAETGTADVDEWYAAREGRTLINYGVSAGHVPVRMKIMRDPGGAAPTGDAARRGASDEEIATIAREIQNGLRRGAVAVGLKPQHTPAASSWEILEMFRVAAAHNAPCFVHLRYQGELEPQSSIVALEEAIAGAAISGAALHVVHVTSNGLRATPRLLQMVGEARSRGLDVTAEIYPYTAASNPIESAMFDEGWQKRLGISYSDLQWVATGERLTAETFAHFRKTGGRVIIHMIPEEIVREALINPLTLVASDGVKGHPRSAGTYARVLGRYVRELKSLSLMDALRKMTLMPAQRLEGRVEAMRNKGRIRVGADADLTIFDPTRVIDVSTYEEPARYSQGIVHVMVNGVTVVKDGRLQDGLAPGRSVRASIY